MPFTFHASGEIYFLSGELSQTSRQVSPISGGEVDTLKCFIFDLDNAPTRLASTELVRVSQWKRRCIENYLINEKAIYDLLRDDGISRDKIESRGEVTGIFREIALGQLNDKIALSVYKQTQFGNLGPPPQRDLYSKTFAQSAEFLFNRISEIQNQVSALERSAWSADFERLCQDQLVMLRPKWETEWVTLCDGKRFFRDLHSRFGVKVPPIKLKVRIMERLQGEHADEWVLVESVLRDVLRQ